MELIELQREGEEVINFGKTFHPEFEGWLTIKENICYISLITSKNKGQGNFSILLNELKERYSKIIITCPSEIMKEIVLKKGFVYRETYLREMREIVPRCIWWKRGGTISPRRKTKRYSINPLLYKLKDALE